MQGGLRRAADTQSPQFIHTCLQCMENKPGGFDAVTYNVYHKFVYTALCPTLEDNYHTEDVVKSGAGRAGVAAGLVVVGLVAGLAAGQVAGLVA